VANQVKDFETEISRFIWDSKYRYREGEKLRDASLQDSWRRLARALASVEPTERERWEERFYQNLSDFRFLPGGRILAGAGTAHQVTLFNCFVMGVIEDSMESIFDRLKEAALTMQQGGGIGVDFSTLRPAGSHAQSTGTIASGPVSFMRIWDSMCATLLSTGSRRGAMMATRAAPLQSIGTGERRLYAGGGGGRRLAAAIPAKAAGWRGRGTAATPVERRNRGRALPGVETGRGAGAVAQDHARHL
jgi:hypothetical protein